MDDFMSMFMDYTSNLVSPDIFRRWSGIALLAGALERRTWAVTDVGPVYPNMYTLLVAPPGVGKYVIEEVRGIWTEATEPGTKTPAFRVSPDSMTKASLIDEIALAKAQRFVPGGQLFVYHSLLIPAEEFSVLLPAYDMEYIGTLNSLYNNKGLHKETRRHGPKREVVIENPQINILGGVQPTFLADVFPENAWSTGLARRIVMIYSNRKRAMKLFGGRGRDENLRRQLVARTGALSKLYGQFKFEVEAAEALGDWHDSGQKPKPTHSRLSHYNESRIVTVIKLSMVSSVSRSTDLVITLPDVTRAFEWLFEAEALMPDVFRDMIGKSDAQVLEELHQFMVAAYHRQGKKTPLRSDVIWEFLSRRVPSQKIEMIILVAENSGMIARVAGTQDQWVPKEMVGMRGVE